jgi:hypothetical protein
MCIMLCAASLDASRAAHASVFQAMLHEVPWMQGEGMPQDIDPHGEYAALLAAGEAVRRGLERG